MLAVPGSGGTARGGRPLGMRLVRREAGNAFRDRSIALGNDPKLGEMRNFVESHKHEDRMLSTTTSSHRQVSPLPAAAPPTIPGTRLDGVRIVDDVTRRLAEEAASALPDLGPPGVAVFGAVGADIMSPRLLRDTGSRSARTPTHIPAATASRLPASMAAADLADAAVDPTMVGRVNWRQNMDRMMRRLLVDVELARQPLLEENGHKMVCDQFDRMYDWYVLHGRKEAAKEREGPAFLRFDAGQPAMPGSLRNGSPLRQSHSRPSANRLGAMSARSGSEWPRR